MISFRIDSFDLLDLETVVYTEVADLTENSPYITRFIASNPPVCHLRRQRIIMHKKRVFEAEVKKYFLKSRKQRDRDKLGYMMLQARLWEGISL